MAFSGSEASSKVVDDCFEVTIGGFSSCQVQNEWMAETSIRKGDLVFSASVSPNGLGKQSIGYVLVKVNEVQYSKSYISECHDVLQWTVSVIDAEGNQRFPRSYTRKPCKVGESLADMELVDFIGEKYLERSFLLSRADELLPNDTLTLRFEISYRMNKRNKENEEKFKRSSSVGDLPALDFYQQTCWHEFVPTTREIIAIKKREESEGGPHPQAHDELFSLKFSDMGVEVSHSQLSCGDNHWTADDSRKNCGCILVPTVMHSDVNNPSSRFRGVECLLEENFTSFAENDWIFQTNPDKYLLSMHPNIKGFGSKFMDASPVIRRVVHSPMAEMRQKRFKLHNVASQTFF